MFSMGGGGWDALHGRRRGEADQCVRRDEARGAGETFAHEAARLVGASENLIEAIREWRKAPRPRWTPMHSQEPMRPWQDALAEFL